MNKVVKEFLSESLQLNSYDGTKRVGFFNNIFQDDKTSLDVARVFIGDPKENNSVSLGCLSYITYDFETIITMYVFADQDFWSDIFTSLSLKRDLPNDFRKHDLEDLDLNIKDEHIVIWAGRSSQCRTCFKIQASDIKDIVKKLEDFNTRSFEFLSGEPVQQLC